MSSTDTTNLNATPINKLKTISSLTATPPAQMTATAAPTINTLVSSTTANTPQATTTTNIQISAVAPVPTTPTDAASTLKLATTKINQYPVNLSSPSVTTTTATTLTTPQAQPPQLLASTPVPANNQSAISGFGKFSALHLVLGGLNFFSNFDLFIAYCINCNEYGVKAAFYGKSKLYCSVACQNGIKKQQQQQQQNHGVKRTIESV